MSEFQAHKAELHFNSFSHLLKHMQNEEQTTNL